MILAFRILCPWSDNAKKKNTRYRSQSNYRNPRDSARSPPVPVSGTIFIMRAQSIKPVTILVFTLTVIFVSARVYIEVKPFNSLVVVCWIYQLS